MKQIIYLIMVAMFLMLQGCGEESDQQVALYLYYPGTLTDGLKNTVQNIRITVDEPEFWRNDTLGGSPLSVQTFDYMGGSDGTLSGIEGSSFQIMVELLNPQNSVVARGYSPVLQEDDALQSIEMMVAPTDQFYYTTNSSKEVTAIQGSRVGHTMTALPDGTILIWGGVTPGAVYTNSQYIYNPLNNRFTRLVDSEFQEPPARRAHHTATLVYLDSDNQKYPRVLITGGYNSEGALNSAELYDPETRTLQKLRSMNNKRGYHTATLMKNGLVMLIGGRDGDTFRKEVEFFSPAQKEFLQFQPLPVAISGHAADNIGDNKIIVTGGYNGSGIQKSIYLIDFKENTTSLLKELDTARAHHKTVIVNEQLFIIGGFTAVTGEQFSGGATSIERLFLSRLNDPVSAWSNVLQEGRGYFTATKLKNNQIAIIGGVNASTSTAALNREILEYGSFGEEKKPYRSDLDPSANAVTPDKMKQARYGHEAILTPTAQVFILGGYYNGDETDNLKKGSILGSSECYNMK